MSPKVRRALQCVVIAFTLVALAAGLRVWPLHELGSRLAWLTFHPAVILAAFCGGIVAGLMATALACLTVMFLWTTLVADPFIATSADWLGMSVFMLTGIMVSSIAEAMHRANVRARKALDQAEGAKQAANASTFAITKSERLIKTITDSLPGMVAYWDAGLRCHFANKAYLDWFGKSPEAMIGNTLQELLGGSSWPSVSSDVWR